MPRRHLYHEIVVFRMLEGARKQSTRIQTKQNISFYRNLVGVRDPVSSSSKGWKNSRKQDGILQAQEQSSQYL